MCFVYLGLVLTLFSQTQRGISSAALCKLERLPQRTVLFSTEACNSLFYRQPCEASRKQRNSHDNHVIVSKSGLRLFTACVCMYSRGAVFFLHLYFLPFSFPSIPSLRIARQLHLNARLRLRSSPGLAGGDERVLGGCWRVLVVRSAVEGEAALEGDAVTLGRATFVLGAEE